MGVETVDKYLVYTIHAFYSKKYYFDCSSKVVTTRYIVLLVSCQNFTSKN